MLEEIHIEKLVHGGQGMGLLASGKRAFVWNALPGEKVLAKVIKKKSSYVDAVAEDILVASDTRIVPIEPEAFLSTSPWQIVSFDQEKILKQDILAELFTREHVDVAWQGFCQLDTRFGYRNKMEYNFWWDNDTQAVSLALHRRGSHMKLPVEGSVLASDQIEEAGKHLTEFINEHSVPARSLKSVIIRSSANGETALVLYVVDRSIIDLPWSEFRCKNLAIYYSEPKSPASVGTELLFRKGAEVLVDVVHGRTFEYAPEGFFQVNIPMYEVVLGDMAQHISDDSDIVDLYAGVGSIGLTMPYRSLVSVEIDEYSSTQAARNAGDDLRVQVLLSASEKVLDQITSDRTLIVDPPRAGLHMNVVNRILEAKPPKILYLSCNPATQARDVKLLESQFKISHARGYNFFPATPHIESLLVLERK